MCQSLACKELTEGLKKAPIHKQKFGSKPQSSKERGTVKVNNTNLEITPAELHELEPDMFKLIDMRDSVAFEYGHITGAVNIDSCSILSKINVFPKDKLLVLYCKSGAVSLETAEHLQKDGYNVTSLKGGYYAWLKEHIDESSRAKDAEQSIRKTYHKELWSKFTKAINDYELVEEGDKIAVCISGGKDSTLMAKLFQELQRHNKFPFELVFLVMDPGYSPENREIIEKNAKSLNIPITVFESNIFNSVYHVEKSPCYLCARMRRGHLYSKAKELGCNKIALGHHFDDVIETILMGMLYGGQVQTMMPKLHSTNFEGMELIRPMYLIHEADIIRWRNFNDLHFIQCACKFTDTCTTCHPDNTGSKRVEVKRLIAELMKTNPQVEANIFRSVEHVNLETVIGYKDSEGLHNFLDNYKEKG